MKRTIAMLGDSVFDNGVYARGGWDVSKWMRFQCPSDEILMLAEDGAVIQDIVEQERSVPRDCDYLVVSVGGNDALGEAYILMEKVETVGDALLELSYIADNFATRYREMLEWLTYEHKNVVVCTIYNGASKSVDEQACHAIVVGMLNNIIIQAALDFGARVIDLRRVMTDYDDYANSIEPGVSGGAKIAMAIANACCDEQSVISPLGVTVDEWADDSWRLPTPPKHVSGPTLDMFDEVGAYDFRPIPSLKADDPLDEDELDIGGDLLKGKCPTCGKESVYLFEWDVDGQIHNEIVQECNCDVSDEELWGVFDVDDVEFELEVGA